MNEDLLVLRTRLKMGEYDGNDIMQAWAEAAYYFPFESKK